MTDPTPSRESSGSIKQDREWRSVIRLAAVPIALIGLALMVNETLEQLRCAPGATCKLHLSTMLWGIGLFSFACLIWQKGDVSKSLDQVTSAGDRVRGWFTRSGRSTDAAGTKVTTIVSPPPSDKTP